MTAVLDLPNGRQIVVNRDGDAIRLTLWANRGCVGVEMSAKDAMALRRALFEAIYP